MFLHIFVVGNAWYVAIFIRCLYQLQKSQHVLSILPPVLAWKEEEKVICSLIISMVNPWTLFVLQLHMVSFCQIHSLPVPISAGSKLCTKYSDIQETIMICLQEDLWNVSYQSFYVGLFTCLLGTNKTDIIYSQAFACSISNWEGLQQWIGFLSSKN